MGNGIPGTSGASARIISMNITYVTGGNEEASADAFETKKSYYSDSVSDVITGHFRYGGSGALQVTSSSSE